jgi:hypothetical protein
MSANNRYINVTPRTPGSNLGLPSNRVLLTNPETGDVVQRVRAKQDEKWVFNKNTKRFNLIPTNKKCAKETRQKERAHREYKFHEHQFEVTE